MAQGNPVPVSIDPFYFSVPVIPEALSRRRAEQGEAHMKFRKLLAGILWTAHACAVHAAFAQTQNDQAALAKQSSIVFSGTVSRLGATSFAGVPQSPNTIVVRVDSVLTKSPGHFA